MSSYQTSWDLGSRAIYSGTLSCSHNSDSEPHRNPSRILNTKRIDWVKEGWYSESIDRSVVSGLLPNVRCDDDVSRNDVNGNEESATTEHRII